MRPAKGIHAALQILNAQKDFIFFLILIFNFLTFNFFLLDNLPGNRGLSGQLYAWVERVYTCATSGIKSRRCTKRFGHVVTVVT